MDLTDFVRDRLRLQNSSSGWKPEGQEELLELLRRGRKRRTVLLPIRPQSSVDFGRVSGSTPYLSEEDSAFEPNYSEKFEQKLQDADFQFISIEDTELEEKVT